MKLANAIQGGIAGVETLGMLQKALSDLHIDGGKINKLASPGIIKKFRKASKKKGAGRTRQYIKLGGELLAQLGSAGLLTKKMRKNALFQGALLGASMGLATVFLNSGSEEGLPAAQINRKRLRTLLLSTLSGLLAGGVLKKFKKKKKKK